MQLPDAAKVREALRQKEAAFAHDIASDVARHELGAKIVTSWGLPEKSAGYIWRRVIDGRRGTS